MPCNAVINILEVPRSVRAREYVYFEFEGRITSGECIPALSIENRSSKEIVVRVNKDERTVPPRSEYIVKLPAEFPVNTRFIMGIDTFLMFPEAGSYTLVFKVGYYTGADYVWTDTRSVSIEAIGGAVAGDVIVESISTDKESYAIDEKITANIVLYNRGMGYRTVTLLLIADGNILKTLSVGVSPKQRSFVQSEIHASRIGVGTRRLCAAVGSIDDPNKKCTTIAIGMGPVPPSPTTTILPLLIIAGIAAAGLYAASRRWYHGYRAAAQ